MRLRFACIAFVFFTEQTSQAFTHIHHRRIPETSNIYRPKPYNEKTLLRRAHAILDYELDNQKRDAAPLSQAAPVASPSAASTPSTMSSSAWNNQTEAACINAITGLNSIATNPAGIAVCYNIPYLSNTTGAFQAELRLYQISPATADWASLNRDGVSFSLTYSDATVAAGNSSIMKRGALDNEIRNGLVERASTRELSVEDFVGQLNNSAMAQATNEAAMKQLLKPNITLSAKAQNGTKLSTSISADQASFVNGVFFNQAITSASTAPAQPTKFVLPGTTLGIFPIGLIITSTWTVLFVGTVGFGTIGRIRFREAYRRRKKRGIAAGANTIS